MWNDLIPYIVPVLVIALTGRRSGKARRIRPERMWTTPAILTIATVAAIFAAGFGLKAAFPQLEAA